MVLPIIIGIGVTAVALTVRSSIRAWEIYKGLSPMTIGRMNNICIKQSPKRSGSEWFLSSRLDPELQKKLCHYPGGFYPKMNESEALLILNICPGEIDLLDKTMLKMKHRKAMIQNHPDNGGSTYIAVKVNEARDLLEKSCMVKNK